jgi:hypothetical protein
VRRLHTLTLVSLVLLVGCQSLLGAEPTVVPGAAATLTRSSRTPIPTPERAASPSPTGSGPVAAKPAASPVALASPQASRPISDDDVAQIESEMQRVVATAALPGIERLLLDRVSLSTPAGGQVLERAEAAQWLRDHAGPGIQVARVEPSAQTMLLEVSTQGWPNDEPLEQGVVTFNLRRYGDNGRPDEMGEWKVDAIGAE